MVVLVLFFGGWLCLSGLCCWSSFGGSFISLWSESFGADLVSVYLSLLTVGLMFCLLVLSPVLSFREIFFIVMSQVFSLLCYHTVNVFLFWGFYELSIVCLLYLVLSESLYPERYTAFWYFLFYLVISGVPMLVSIVTTFYWTGAESCLSWVVLQDYGPGVWGGLLFLLFVTKIPLFPFHSWLPAVHADSSSAVSVCLSGYVMKLGVLGLFRFCCGVLFGSELLFGYIGVLLFLACLFFLYSLSELDVKRWLAFLSVSHIVVVPVSLSFCCREGVSLGLLYSVGHAFSAGASFIYFWYVGLAIGSRCWFVLKNGLVGSQALVVLSGAVLCGCCSLPVCLQFFCELGVVHNVTGFSSFYCLGFFFYLFVSSLVPLICLGYTLTRFRDVVPCRKSSISGLLVVGFLALVNFVVFLIF